MGHWRWSLRFAFAACAALALSCSLVGPSRAQTDWRNELGTFRVGIVANADSDRAAIRAEPFRLALEEGLGMPVEIYVARDYAALAAAASQQRIEYAVLSALAYAIAWKNCECIEGMAVPRAADGSNAFREILIGHAGGPSSIANIAAARIGLIDSVAAGGIEIALAELAASGTDLKDKRQEMLAKPDGESLLRALAEREVDAIFGWSSQLSAPQSADAPGTFQRMGILEMNPADYKIIWQSSPVPYRVHAVSIKLAAEAKTIIRSLLTAMFNTDPVAYDAIEPVLGGGFDPARPGMFEKLQLVFEENTGPASAE
ncbi:MAG: PhnD/SsuA/transferrin family substrate-binding protein [Rhizobiaceae bacterium]